MRAGAKVVKRDGEEAVRKRVSTIPRGRMDRWIAPLARRCASGVKALGSKPNWAWLFFRLAFALAKSALGIDGRAQSI